MGQAMATPLSAARPALTGAAVIVTNAASPIGAEVIRHFAEAGARILAAGPDAQALASTLAIAQRFGALDYASFAADLTEPVNAAKLMESALEIFGRIDILINIGTGDAALNCAHGALAHMADEACGCIIHIAMAAASDAGPFKTANVMTNVLAQMGASTGITINTLVCSDAAAIQGTVALAVFLCTPSAAGMTGQTIHINGANFAPTQEAKR